MQYKCELKLMFSGGALVLTDENCMLYRHVFTPDVDHLYFEHDGQGYYIFSRRDLYNEWERKFGLTLTRAYAKDGDVDAYTDHCGESLDDELRRFEEGNEGS
jgi:hypothetical protein